MLVYQIHLNTRYVGYLGNHEGRNISTTGISDILFDISYKVLSKMNNIITITSGV